MRNRGKAQGHRKRIEKNAPNPMANRSGKRKFGNGWQTN